MDKKLNYVTVAIDSESLKKRKSWHVLVYNDKNDYYYAMTVHELFKMYEDKQSAMRKEIDSFVDSSKREAEEFTNSMENRFSEFKNSEEAASAENMEKLERFKSDMVSRYNDLLTQFKELSVKLITMVENGGN